MTPFLADWTRRYDINPVVHSLYDAKHRSESLETHTSRMEG